MIEYNNTRSEAKDEKRVVTDFVCPECFCQVDNPTVMTEGTDPQGRELRQYFGYCHKCNAAHVVIQFRREARWVIHKYRAAVVLGIVDEINVSDGWKLMSELPPPAQPNNAESSLLESLQEMHRAMKGCAITIECLINDLLNKKNGNCKTE